MADRSGRLPLWARVALPLVVLVVALVIAYSFFIQPDSNAHLRIVTLFVNVMQLLLGIGFGSAKRVMNEEDRTSNLISNVMLYLFFNFQVFAHSPIAAHSLHASHI